MATPAQKKPFHIAIIGGGISGLMLAIALHKRKISCTIYEQAAAFGEIGAGVSISRNAVRAMEVIDRSVVGAFNIVATRNKWEGKRGVWFDFMDGMSHEPAPRLQPLFSMVDPGVGQNAVHRARFLDELVKLLPRGAAQFHKKLDHILDDRIGSGKMLMKFKDGSVAEADAIIGCDGIKSRTRVSLVGEGHPAATPVYTHKYAYRGLVPMDEAIHVLGEERAVNAHMWLGQNRHVLTFPVDHGAMMNMVAFVTNNREEWPSTSKLTLATTKAEALDDFREFGENVKNIIQLTSDRLDRWAIFDLGDHPLSTYYKGRVCLVGDAAHATSPHHGAGAGFCIEDAAFLASLLADPQVTEPLHVEVVFAVYDAHRRARTQWLVRSSRRAGNLYEWLTQDVGTDFARMERELAQRLGHIWDFDLEDSIREATKDLHRRLNVPGVHKCDSQVMPFITNEQDGVETQ
ncbi:putative salicylate hydroxylase [Cryphonectria parasitica EP155]|uniref:Salicylate hydroxylase n=1 Tax=Cryphonectria parasitica (strain ATCC 38755 / EP155) TaxID=660469 RepID=A0A9P4XU59_CRYP1|nr:putative salicylate hydroxylase [Cryphonectria parasitica EP155]KAF3760951.1 putative salicylate hydroxylase [Cryphonectria parasitica EP155]